MDSIPTYLIITNVFAACIGVFGVAFSGVYLHRRGFMDSQDKKLISKMSEIIF